MAAKLFVTGWWPDKGHIFQVGWYETYSYIHMKPLLGLFMKEKFTGLVTQKDNFANFG